jgi:tetratricopeptide (TPR) repeat protein
LGEGQAAFEKILTLNADDFEARLGLVQVLYQMGKISEASVRIEGILQNHPNSAEAYLYSAKIKLSEGDHEFAREHYLKGISINSGLRDGAIEKGLKDAGLWEIPHNSEQQVPVLNTETGWVSGESQEESGSHVSHGIRDIERPSIKFSDVGGMENIKEEIRLKIIYPLQSPDIYKAYGKKTGGGVLLYGPPGCGKTLVSRATAGEIKANFISIGLHQILDMYVGNSEKNLHEIFELARKHVPSILFIDEIDAMAANRADLRHSASRTVINQFLAEMDGGINSNEGVLILGATNAPWSIDAAFRRPGRFDRMIFVPTPDEDAG